MRPLYSDERTREEILELIEEVPYEVVFNLLEDIQCLKEDVEGLKKRF